MARILNIILLLMAFKLSACSQSPDNMKVHYKSGVTKDIPIELIDSITFTENKSGEDGEVFYSISFEGEPIKILSTEDADATEIDNQVMGYFNIVKVKENLFYLYYIAVGKGEEIKNETYDLCMAYSTDGFHWTRGIPGIEGGNNIVMPQVIEQSVFMVPDEDYPFRLIGNEGKGNLKIWKSKDGISFTDKKDILTDRWHDTQNAGVVQGDRIKVYTRLWNPTATNRQNGVAYIDFDGNQLTKIVKLAGDYLYNAAPLQIDERYEILLPTFFNNKEGKDDSSHLKAFLLDGYYAKEIDCNLNKKLGGDVGWCLVSPYLINIAGGNYVSYYTSTVTHDNYQNEQKTNSYYLIKVTISKEYTNLQ